MADQSEPLALAAEFPAATREDWRELVAGVLRRSGGAHADPDLDPEAALSTRLYDGIDVKPLYTAHDGLSVAHDGLPGHPPFVRAASRDGASATGWDVRQLHLDPDPRRTNAAALHRPGQRRHLAVASGRGRPGRRWPTWPRRSTASISTWPRSRSTPARRPKRRPPHCSPWPTSAACAREELSGTLGADPIGTCARTGTAG